MLERTTTFLKEHWPLLASFGALLASCLVGVRDWLTIRKLRFELSQLKDAQALHNSRIIQASLEEIEKYARRSPMWDRGAVFRIITLGSVLIYILGGVAFYVLGFVRFAGLIGIVCFVYLAVHWTIKRLFLREAADELQGSLRDLKMLD